MPRRRRGTARRLAGKSITADSSRRAAAAPFGLARSGDLASAGSRLVGPAGAGARITAAPRVAAGWPRRTLVIVARRLD